MKNLTFINQKGEKKWGLSEGKGGVHLGTAVGW